MARNEDVPFYPKFVEQGSFKVFRLILSENTASIVHVGDGLKTFSDSGPNPVTIVWEGIVTVGVGRYRDVGGIIHNNTEVTVYCPH